MCHDDCRPFEIPFQLAHEPPLARMMKLDEVLGRKSSPTVMDRGKVFDQPLCTLPSELGLAFALQLEVGPQRTTEP